jgi:uncharacterized membrane protein YbhN (UPF0104 family)
LLDDIRTKIEQRRELEPIELAQIQRIGFGSIITFAGFVFLLIVAIEFFANWDAIFEQLRKADYAYVPPILALTASTYVGGAVSLQGAVVRHLALSTTTLIMVAQSFLNRFTPMNAGGMAMRVRFLQKGGTGGTEAATAIGLTSVVNGIVQTVLIFVFILWAGTGETSTFSLPSIQTALFVCGGIFAVVAVVYCIPRVRHLAISQLREIVGKIRAQLGELLGRPARIIGLFGGNTGSKIAIIGAWVLSCRALDIDLGVAQLGVLYLVGSTIGSTVPAPGGVGPVEVALIAALTGAGVDTATATAATLFFRMLTYWAPVPFGYVALRYSRKMELV